MQSVSCAFMLLLAIILLTFSQEAEMQNLNFEPNDQALRWIDLQKIVPLSKTSIWRMERDGIFPKRRKMGKKLVVWLRSEVENWLNNLEVSDQTIDSRGIENE